MDGNEAAAPVAKTAVERFVARLRANPVVATLIVVAAIVASLASFTDSATKLLALFAKPSPAAARTSLAQMNQAYTAEAFVASAAAGDVIAVKLFLKAGMDPNAVSQAAGTAIGNAAFRGHADVVTALLDGGASIAGVPGWPSPLGSAAAGGHDDIVQSFLDHKPAPSDAAIDEAFVMAARRSTFPEQRHFETMKLLAAHGAHVRTLAADIFDEVFTRGLGDDDAKAITAALVELGADANGGAGDDGKPVTMMTPLMGAASAGYRATAEWLLAHGARLEARYDGAEKADRGWTALMIAVRQREPELVEFLIDRGAVVEATNSDGDSPLLLAARSGDARSFGAVLAKATTLDARDSEGHNALMLLAAGVPWPDGTVVHPESIEALLRRGVRIDERSPRGETALMLAAASGSADAVRLLLAHGARVDDRDARGRRAIDYARDGDDPANAGGVIRLLQRS